MRFDVISIFPDYFAPLHLSLIGRAISRGEVGLNVHDLRDFTHDRHRTVDDTPYGGGAGMVMRPQPWGEALDSVLAPPLSSADAELGQRCEQGERVLIVPSPAGSLFNQAKARELAQCEQVIFACGRYEGIDQRVIEHARSRVRVEFLSLGDYVLNGGEVAVLAMIEAIVRLIPGVIGNPQSLTEESHEDGLLEYPVYTKPEQWRGLDVPPVLLSGDHGLVARWRRDQRLLRTQATRPEMIAQLSADALSDEDHRVLAAAALLYEPENLA